MALRSAEAAESPGLAGHSLTRQYAEPVAVRRGDDRPVQFVWRRRHYVVRDVLEHWVATDAWWDAAMASGADAVPGSLDDEWEFWRVEAAAGSAAPAVVDLGFRCSTGQWIVQRLFD